MRLTLGIDVGTFESKGVLVEAGGRIVAAAVRPHQIIVPAPGFAEHRAIEDWWADVCALSRQLIARSGVSPAAIKAVGLSAIGPCMLPLDGDGQPLMNAVLYGVDGRARREIAEMTEAAGEAAILERCGNPLSTQAVGPKILWLKRNRPDLFASTRRIVTATSYLVMRLAGTCPVDPYTASTFGPLYDLAGGTWTDALAPGLLPLDWLPDIAWPTSIAGAVTAAAAAETGLAAGTPVIAGTVDAAAEAVSVGVRRPGDMMMMYGSSIFIIEVTKALIRDRRLWTAPWLFPGEFAAMAALATAGTLTRWAHRELARELDAEGAMAALAAEAAASPPGARGLLALPYFAGIQTPLHDASARGAFIGLGLEHGRADMMRALIEGIAYAVGDIIAAYGAAGAAPAMIAAVGGGTRNRVWTQTISDVIAAPQHLRRTLTGAAYGDAFLAALAIGEVTREAIDEWNPEAAVIEPEPAGMALHRPRLAAFLALREALRGLPPAG